MTNATDDLGDVPQADTCFPTGQPAVPLPQAARLLGVTPEAVRQRIRRGKLSATKVGRDWYVNLAPPLTVVRPLGQADATLDQPADVLATVTSVGQADAGLTAALQAEVAFLKDEIIFLRAELQRKEERLQAVTARAAPPPDWSPPLECSPAPPVARPRRRWWRW